MGFYDDDDGRDIALARKVRPWSMEGYVGNSAIKETFRRYMRSGKRPQSILITGPSGCGKTTLSRIFELEYNCENYDPENGACGECPSCMAFKEYIQYGRSDYLANVYEIDASDKSSKKDIDTMLDTMDYPTMGGGWKCYLIDEAHLLSEGAMGRLLKTFEEPPEDVLIILCTTNPEGLLDTITNRCQLKLRVEKPTTTEIMGLLKGICIAEDKEYDLEGLRMIAGRADHVIRDSLNYLETVLATRGNAKSISVSEEFQQVTDKLIYDFYDAYIRDDYVGYIGVIYEIKSAYGFEQFLMSLINFTVRGIYILNGVTVEGMTTEEVKSYMNLFQRFTPKEISKVLSDLKKMSLGNVEANLMSFIYCKGDDLSEVENLTPKISTEVSVKDEIKFRNNNLDALERAKEEEGRKAVAEEMEMLSVGDLGKMFSLEKVE